MNQILKNNYKIIKKQFSPGPTLHTLVSFGSFAIEYLNKNCVSLPVNIGPAIQVSKGIWKNKYIPNRKQ